MKKISAFQAYILIASEIAEQIRHRAEEKEVWKARRNMLLRASHERYLARMRGDE